MKIKKLNEGISLGNNNKYIFDSKFDNENDLLFLNTDNSGISVINDLNLTYFFAYSFNTDKYNIKNGNYEEIKQLRSKLKTSANNSMFESGDLTSFAESGILRFNKYYRLSDFDVVVSAETTASDKSSTLMNYLDCAVAEYVGTKNLINIKMIKNLCKDVIFDKQKAYDALKNDIKYKDNESKITEIIESINKLFIKSQNTNDVFKMKEYLPAVARIGFSNLFRFKSEEQSNLYKSLEKGSKVLIYDDFITSGTTILDIMNTLNSINSNNELYVFILVDRINRRD